jgi:RNA polymerase sigma factor (sigma-70 family)
MRNVELKNLSLEVLIVEYQTTNNNAYFGELYNRHYSNLFAYCKKIMGNSEDAYDITADTFIKAAEKIGQLSQPFYFPSWLFRIAHNMCIDSGKAKQKNQTVGIQGQLNLACEEVDVEAMIKKEAMLNQLEVLMSDLDADSREILVQKYFYNKSITDLQKQFKLSASAVKMRLVRARNKVAELALV